MESAVEPALGSISVESQGSGAANPVMPSRISGRPGRRVHSRRLLRQVALCVIATGIEGARPLRAAEKKHERGYYNFLTFH